MVSVAVQFFPYPMLLNKYLESTFPNISSLLPIYTLTVPLAFVSYQAIIELSSWADTSHAVLSIYVFVEKSYTVAGILSTNVTLSTFCLWILVFPKKLSV